MLDVCLQKDTDELLVELQNSVQSVSHTEAEIQQLFSLLQDLESGMNTSKQRQEEVCPQSNHHVSGRSSTFNLYLKKSVTMSLVDLFIIRFTNR